LAGAPSRHLGPYPWASLPECRPTPSQEASDRPIHRRYEGADHLGMLTSGVLVDLHADWVVVAGAILGLAVSVALAWRIVATALRRERAAPSTDHSGEAD
jgi:hypothetical protein